MQSWPLSPSVGAPAIESAACAPGGEGGAGPWLPEVLSTMGAGAPAGLAWALLESRATTAARFWVLDNSGSMGETDGQQLSMCPDGTFAFVRCSRWEELREVASQQARLAVSLRSRVDFHLLNPPQHPPGARQFVSLGLEYSQGGAGSQGGAASLQDLYTSLASSPTGTTPLTEAVATIVGLVAASAPSLCASGQVVVVVLATDGRPNDPNSFVQAVRELQALRCVWVVVRLCTQSEEVLEYWNDLDRQLEAPLEVLDDATAEAREIAQANPWLTYGFPLHLLRTAGVRHKLFDLMDEQAFIGSQLSDMCSLLFGCGPLPNPEADWLGFQERLGGLLAATPRIFCPVARELRPWVDLKVLREKFGRSVKRPMFGPAPDASLSAFPPASLSPPPPPLTEPWVFLTLSATKLEKKDTWSKNDPFFTISYWAGEVGQSILLANSDAIQNKKKPEWKSMYFARSALQPWDPSPAGRLRFDVFDFEDDHKHQAIGHCWTSVEELLERREAELQLTSPRGGGKVSGLLTIKAGSVS
mmetsp:Transcript_538/g.1628  ORF Transcript_538/g.1628 Transcript_538/m.1628 type:complete len:530 (-) Transcript_538:86-1675(-)